MADTKYYVRGQSDSSYESMTKEEILTAISGTVPALDSGFITIWKEQNAGVGIKLWVGTTAQYNALDPKPTNTLYIKTDDRSAQDIADAIQALNDALDALEASLAGYAPEDHAYSTTKYGAATSSNYGHVKLITNLTTAVSYPDGTAMRGDLAYFIGQRLSAIESVTADTGWKTLTVSGTGWSAGTNTPQYRKIGNHVYLRGDIEAGNTTPSAQPISAPYAPTKTSHVIWSTNSSAVFASVTVGANATVINDDMSKYEGLTVHLDSDYFTD